MNFFCIQSTDQKFPLESSGFTSLLFVLSARTRFVQPSLSYARFHLSSTSSTLRWFPVQATCVIHNDNGLLAAWRDEIDLLFS
jgi:hypothetical protein